MPCRMETREASGRGLDLGAGAPQNLTARMSPVVGQGETSLSAHTETGAAPTFRIAGIARGRHGPTARGFLHRDDRGVVLSVIDLQDLLGFYGLVPTAQWKGVEIKNVPTDSACSTACRHSVASSSVRVGRMSPWRNCSLVLSEKVLMKGNIFISVRPNWEKR